MSAPQVFELLLGLTAACVLLSVVADKLRLPPAAAFTVGGMALALLPQAPAVELDPNLTMLLFVPIFASYMLFTFPRVFLFGGLIQGCLILWLFGCALCFPFSAEEHAGA